MGGAVAICWYALTASSGVGGDVVDHPTKFFIKKKRYW
jgi:hypothetical protein